MPTRIRERTLAAVLFTDIVGSTNLAAELGDRRWRELLSRHYRILRQQLKRYHGEEIDTAGDGFFASFQEPGAAIRCAFAASGAVRELGIEIRAGVHFGEVEPMDGKLGGIAVHTGARIVSEAGPGEILVSLTTRDLVAGAGVHLDDRGTHSLKGITDEIRLFAVTGVDGEVSGPPLSEDDAAERLARIPPASPLRGRRGTVVIAAAVGLIAAIGVSVALSISESETPPQPQAQGLPANAVAAFDVRTGDTPIVQGNVPSAVGFQSREIEVGEGSVWLLRNPVFVKLDPADGSFSTKGLSSGGLGPAGTYGLGVGFGRAWTMGYLRLFEVDAGTFDQRVAIRDPRQENLGAPAAIATGFGSLWLGDQFGMLFRVDPDTYDIDRIDVGDLALQLAVGEDGVWVLDDFVREVIHVNPSTNEVAARVPLTQGLDRIAIGEGFVWVLDTTAGVLTPIEERSGDVREPISVGEGATDVAVGFGSVWVASGGSVLRIDPVTKQVEDRFDLGHNPIIRLAVDTQGGRLWLDVGRAS